jgi:hypothetical protein
VDPFLASSLSPVESAESLSVWRRFMDRGIPSLRAKRVAPIPASAEYFVVYPAFGRHPATEFVLRNCMMRLDGDWGLQIITTAALKPWISGIVGDWSGIRVDVWDKATATGKALSLDTVTRQIEFWNLCRGDTQLFLDGDSLLCHGNISEFLGYDYVAPLWGQQAVSPWCRFGSGGLSLRRKEAMVKVCRECNTNSWLIGPEDVFFSIVMRLEGHDYRLPDDELAARFAVEREYHPRPFALHRPWRYLPADKLANILEGVRF